MSIKITNIANDGETPHYEVYNHRFEYCDNDEELSEYVQELLDNAYQSGHSDGHGQGWDEGYEAGCEAADRDLETCLKENPDLYLWEQFVEGWTKTKYDNERTILIRKFMEELLNQ
jgi:hypothetical protein